MKKFNIIKQRVLFNEDEIINETNKTYRTIIKADRYEYAYDEFTVTTENIKIAEEFKEKFENGQMLIGKTYQGSRRKIIFYGDETQVDIHNIFADPYFRLLDEKGEELEKHISGFMFIEKRQS